jgi:hypothetical protein
MQEPCMVRLWSTSDDQAVIVFNGLDCAIYVLQSEHGYGRSVGDPTRNDTFELVDQAQRVGSLSCGPGADVITARARPAFELAPDCPPWLTIARRATLRRAEKAPAVRVTVDVDKPATLSLRLADASGRVIGRRARIRLRAGRNRVTVELQRRAARRLAGRRVSTLRARAFAVAPFGDSTNRRARLRVGH